MAVAATTEVVVVEDVESDVVEVVAEVDEAESAAVEVVETEYVDEDEVEVVVMAGNPDTVATSASG